VDQAEEALLIPKDAVYLRSGSKYVQVLEDGEPVEREIETGIEDNNLIQVTGGLTEGEEVVLNYLED